MPLFLGVDITFLRLETSGVWWEGWGMGVQDKMRAVVTVGHGGLEQLVVRDDWACPIAGAGEVLVRVGACGLNNTDINTRLGWYSKSITSATNEIAEADSPMTATASQSKTASQSTTATSSQSKTSSQSTTATADQDTTASVVGEGQGDHPPHTGGRDVRAIEKASGRDVRAIEKAGGRDVRAIEKAGGRDVRAIEKDQSWGGKAVRFPRIQGADPCGEIVAVGAGVSATRIGERVITDNWLRDPSDPLNKDKTGYFGSERDGGFAEYTTIPAQNALAINSPLSDAELATFSCSYSTAEGMLSRAEVQESDTVLIAGASGGVGSALVQLAKCRGAKVIALASEAKHAQVAELGADKMLPRSLPDLRSVLAGEKITVVADVVGGDNWHKHIDLLERGGRYVCAGAIAGPMVQFDLRTFYLRDLSFFGSTVQAPDIMARVVALIEAGRIRPVLGATYPLAELRSAQEAFIAKQHVGNIVVCP